MDPPQCLCSNCGIAVRSLPAMKRFILAAALALLATAGHAQSFVTVAPEPKGDAWWLRAEFTPLHTEVRGIPAGQLKSGWCKATEFTRELFPPGLLVEDGTDWMAEGRAFFTVKGRFDRSKTEQTVLVGVYETCDGKKGSFVLVLDEGTKKIRFVDTIADKAEFAALQAGRGEIHVLHCLACDNASTLRWNAKKRAFVWK
jgi:hypothetical protein